MPDVEFKICPYCRERIRDTAIKCRFCGEWLEAPPAIETSRLPDTSRMESAEPSPREDIEEIPAEPAAQVEDAQTHDPLDEFDTPAPSQILEPISISSPDATNSAPSQSHEINSSPVREQTETWSDRLVDKMAETVLPSTEDESAATVPTAPVRKGNYFARHWRGDLTLGVSYWGNGFLVAFLFVVVAAIVGVVGQTASLRFVAVLCIAMWFVWFALVVWQFVGTWRSAGKHVARGGKSGWANTARIFLVIGCLNALGTAWKTVIPQIAEYCRILAGDTSYPAYEVRVLPNGKEIEFRGGLRTGSANEFERILKAVPQATVLRINSVGGRIAEAQKMARLVREHSLNTYTSEYCLSAATLIFIAGKERILGEAAKLGFHSATFPGVNAEDLKLYNEGVLQAMRSAGIGEDFISQALATPNTEMWYPTYEELRRANVVTSEYAPGKKLASSALSLMSSFTNIAGAKVESTGNAELDRMLNSFADFYKDIFSMFSDMNSDLEVAGNANVYSDETLTNEERIRNSIGIQLKRQKIIENYTIKARKHADRLGQELSSMNLTDEEAQGFARGFRNAFETVKTQMEELFTRRSNVEVAKSRFLAFMFRHFSDYTVTAMRISFATQEETEQYSQLVQEITDSEKAIDEFVAALGQQYTASQQKLKTWAR